MPQPCRRRNGLCTQPSLPRPCTPHGLREPKRARRLHAYMYVRPSGRAGPTLGGGLGTRSSGVRACWVKALGTLGSACGESRGVDRTSRWDGNRKLWPLGPCCLVRRAERVHSVNNNKNSLLSCYKMALFSWRERRAAGAGYPKGRRVCRHPPPILYPIPRKYKSSTGAP